MSFTKKIYQDTIIKSVEKINTQTLTDNDITPLLNVINNTFDILDGISQSAPDIGVIWNEIASDVISSINSATSGFYRQAIITLRSILELGCSSFFYIDHKVEYHLFKVHDAKADKYVSALIRDYDFFTTNYISSFYTEIKSIQAVNNSISLFLNKVYKQLSDVVHGRYKTLTKKDILKIDYDKTQFNFFKDKLRLVMSILATMYILRFDDTQNPSLVDLANQSGTVKL
ncbi:hypothetical protein P4G85_29120 [Bacillus cereus]|jgi:hypothetical protein|uniref:Uncharacterized protein n=2 Tax=Bacillus cereus group TaxID=86661 RepID=A0A9W5KWW4_BACCE|nr:MULTISPECIES: hypothetical protein [Bacillus cereus group]MEB8734210.1 hypothetical protein [Bacillus cereus]EJR71527.1 hypothetical protein IK5_02993 [Bacillus cereus VD154]KIU74677.1 hypothetical protein C797_10473 [Bacillus thuringiensis Sbt003]MCA1002842.1 hypothetical protein [Bacillus thuringiensis]MEB8752294.1 hypothetical protein [Bacillus cereus]